MNIFVLAWLVAASGGIIGLLLKEQMYVMVILLAILAVLVLIFWEKE